MAKKKVKPNKRAKATIQKAASKKPVIRLTKKELARVQKAHGKSKPKANEVITRKVEFVLNEPHVIIGNKFYEAVIVLAGHRAAFKDPWLTFKTGPHAGKRLRWDGKPLAKIIADYEANPPTTPDEAAERNLGRD